MSGIPSPAGPSLAPDPGAAPAARRVRAHAGLELATQLGNGEQLLLTVVIPTVLLLLFTGVPLVDVGEGRRVDFMVPGILALAVIATAFTGQAIGTGFERRYGVLKRLGASPLGHGGLLAGKTLAVLAVEVGQVALLAVVGLLLGWEPHAGGWPPALLLLLVGTVTFSLLGLALAGALRAEATLAVANLVFVLLLLSSGIVVPLATFPDAVQPWLELLPSTALATGLRTAFAGGGLEVGALVTLLVWAVVGGGLAARTFRWE